MLKKTLNSILATGLVASSAMWAPQASASEPFLAEIVMFGSNFAPRGWAFCDGQLLAISSNSALFSLLGTIYGGDGRTTFALPDMRGRNPIGARQGPGLPDYRLGERGGAPSVVLSLSQLPSHNHGVFATATSNLTGLSATLKGYNSRGNSATPGGNSLASKSRTNIYSSNAPDVAMHSGSVELSGGTVTTTVSVTQNNVGSGQAISVQDPYLAINFIIALQGIYPSRS